MYKSGTQDNGVEGAANVQEAPSSLQLVVEGEGEIRFVNNIDDANGRGKLTRVTDDKASVLLEACSSLLNGDVEHAGQILDSEYPFERIERKRRTYSCKQVTAIFVRDGFIDRYSGKRLVFPASLQLISALLPDKFPSHPNGKMSETHIAFWELWPTIDHIVPIARGGADEPSNWACTSVLRNSIKSNWTLEELGWTLMEGGHIEGWDGLMGWFFQYTSKNEKPLEDPYLKKWWIAAKEYVT